jgi:hypothetical protein
LWFKDARLPLQNGVQDLRLLSELQRLLLIDARTERQMVAPEEKSKRQAIKQYVSALESSTLSGTSRTINHPCSLHQEEHAPMKRIRD